MSFAELSRSPLYIKPSYGFSPLTDITYNTINSNIMRTNVSICNNHTTTTYEGNNVLSDLINELQAMRHSLQVERKRREEIEGLYNELTNMMRRQQAETNLSNPMKTPTSIKKKKNHVGGDKFANESLSPAFVKHSCSPTFVKDLEMCIQFIHPMNWAPTMGKLCFTVSLTKNGLKCNKHNKKFRSYQITGIVANTTWETWRRYSEFDALQKKLKHMVSDVASLPVLPPKTWCRKINNDSFAEVRRCQLEVYMHKLLEIDGIYKTKDVRKFLGLNSIDSKESRIF